MTEVVSAVKSEEILITNVEKGQGGSSQYLLDVSRVNAAGYSARRLCIDWDYPVTVGLGRPFTGWKFWEGLCTASQLESLSHSGAFPISCQAYFDPETNEPVAILVKDFLALVVS